MSKKRAYELVKYVKTKLGTPYIYGAKQPYAFNKKYYKADIQRFSRQYPGYIWKSDFKKAGKVCCDCSGLISAYTEKQKGSWDLYHSATKRWQIKSGNNWLWDNLKEVPVGAILWKSGHVGVFIGYIGKTPYYIAEDGSAYNCRRAKVKNSGFTHALLIPDISYNIKKTYKATNKKKIKAYKSSKTKKAKRTFKKGKTFRIMAEYNGRGLLKKHSAKANLWVDLKDIKKK